MLPREPQWARRHRSRRACGTLSWPDRETDVGGHDQMTGITAAAPTVTPTSESRRDAVASPPSLRQSEGPDSAPRRPTSLRWQRAYARALAFSDTGVTVVVLAAVWLFAPHPSLMPVERLPVELHATVVVGVIGAVVLLLLWMTGSRGPRVVGAGIQEYRAVTQACFVSFALAALCAYALGVDGLRFVLVYGLLALTSSLLLSRWGWRAWLAAQRRAGRMANRVLVVGSTEAIAATARDLARAPSAGLRVVGACTPSGQVAGTIPGTDIPVSGSMDHLLEALRRVDADTVLVSSASELSSSRVRALSWQLEPGRQHLIVAPSLTDIGGPRLHTRPVAGLPLVHVETPRYQGGKLYVKRGFDLIAAGILVVVVSPLLVAAAIAVKATSPGEVFFRQERVGHKGRRFMMLKFRSMFTDAEERLAELTGQGQDRGNDIMFKMKDDPRVTRAGAFMRRFSIDELPQLFNVLRGDMSLVGPRPPLEREVAQYADTVHRRFLVKPGITGLWQVSGRSDLDWDETVRLDLFYVENWTLTGDLAILLRTVRAVFGSDGAY